MVLAREAGSKLSNGTGFSKLVRGTAREVGIVAEVGTTEVCKGVAVTVTDGEVSVVIGVDETLVVVEVVNTVAGSKVETRPLAISRL